MSYFVGAYASSPNFESWDPELETRYYEELKKIPNMKGLEHPFVGSLHPHSEKWFLDNIDPKWDFVLTCVPGIMAALAANKEFGLASNNEVGRLAALDFMQGARNAIATLNAHAGRQAVQAIQIQTAPNQSLTKSSADSLRASLETMQAWDWEGAQIVVEHCDTWIEGQDAAKGFLLLEDEISVLKSLNEKTDKPFGMVINWGRSVIEMRDKDGAAKQIQQVKESGLLTGLMFSGVSDQNSEYGKWQDTHMPPKMTSIERKGEPCSLLTEAEMHRCLTLAGGKESTPSIVGIKLGIRPLSASLEERVAYNRDALIVLDNFFS